MVIVLVVVPYGLAPNYMGSGGGGIYKGCLSVCSANAAPTLLKFQKMYKKNLVKKKVLPLSKCSHAHPLQC